MLIIVTNKLRVISRYISRWFNLSNIKDEDLRRRSLILIIILSSLLVLSLAGLLHGLSGLIVKRQMRPDNDYLGVSIFIFIISIFILLAKKGYARLISVIIIALLLLATFNTSYRWGVNVPQAMVTYALIIFMSGILIGPKSSIFTTFIVSSALLLMYHYQNIGVVKVITSWKLSKSTIFDILVLDTTYFVIAIVSWLSSNEISKSLKRAKRSEKDALVLAEKLKKQNEDLEIIVNQRTKELREHQLKQLIEINNLADFGKLSAGLLHDIKNPLTVISMNLDSIKCNIRDNLGEKINLQKLINKSLMAAKTIESVIKSSQKQLIYEDEKEWFSVKNEIKNTLVLLDHRANKYDVRIELSCQPGVKIFGYPAKLSRIVANLVMNSIDSFCNFNKDIRKVSVRAERAERAIVIRVTDNGCGIKDDHKSQIFEPLFSTKNDKERTGLGLYISRRMLEEYFNGTMLFESKEGKGSEFILKIPIDHDKKRD